MTTTSGEDTIIVDAPTPTQATGRGQVPRPVRRRGTWRERMEITVLAGPAVVVFVTFVILPIVLAAYYGFFKWKGFGVPTNFVGLENYITIFQDPTFRDALLHNGMIVVLSLLMQGPAAVALALLKAGHVVQGQRQQRAHAGLGALLAGR